MIPMARVIVEDDEIESVVQVLRSGALRQGKVCSAFETAFAASVGAQYAVACSSGTAALHLAYLAILEPGDEVLVPAFTFAATATAAVACGAIPVFVDVDPNTLLMDPSDAVRKVTTRTRAIAPVHLYGNACDVDPVLDMAHKHDLCVVWDAAQAHGTRFNGKDVGCFPDLVCYSFYPTKNMTTGEGGMVTTQDASLAERIRLLRSHGMQGKYNHVVMGLNYRMTDIAAAIGLRQLTKVEARNEQRRDNAARLTKKLSNVRGLRTVQTTVAAKHSYHQFTIMLDFSVLKGTREDFQDRMKQKGVETAVHYPLPLHRQSIFAGRDRGAPCPHADGAAATVCSVPVHAFLTDEEVETVGEAVVRVATEMSR